uniref:Uncharacterized protein n=1 Tax=Octopus bimaculoides TaxID=37653 RepID=A0A0L8G1A6_OCTBM
MNVNSSFNWSNFQRFLTLFLHYSSSKQTPLRVTTWSCCFNRPRFNLSSSIERIDQLYRYKHIFFFFLSSFLSFLLFSIDIKKKHIFSL